jgi:hypothetical protein
LQALPVVSTTSLKFRPVEVVEVDEWDPCAGQIAEEKWLGWGHVMLP